MKKQIQKVVFVLLPLVAVALTFAITTPVGAQYNYDTYGSGNNYDTYGGGYNYDTYGSGNNYDTYGGGYNYDTYGSTWGGGWDTYSGLDPYSGYSNDYYGSGYNSGYYGTSGYQAPYGTYPNCDYTQYCAGYDTTTYVVVPGPVTVTQNNNQNQNTNVNVGSTNTTPTPVPAPTVTISANPNVVDQGGSTTLTWTSQNAVSCTASGSWTGSKNISGSEVRGNIFSTQNYTITCYNSAGQSATAQTSVTVRAAQPVTVDITASPMTVQSGGTSVLSWNSSGADFCTASGDWFGGKSVDGSEVRSNLQGNRTYNYTITCFGTNGGQASDSVSVVVQGVQNFPPTVDITANPNYVSYNGQSTLSWTSQNANYCVASGDWYGTKTPSGSEVRSNITSTRTYTITCYNDAGQSAVDSTTVTTQTQHLPISVDITADQYNVASGASTVLRWTSQNADSCTASGDWFGQKSIYGEQSTGALYRTSTFYITCFNNSTGQSANDSVTVTTQGGNPGGYTTVTSLPSDPGTYSCTFYGSVLNSRFTNTTVWFDYGSTTNLGTQTPHVALGSVTSANFNRTVSGLSANSRYYYRAVAQTETGISYGAVLSCITGTIVTPPPTGTSSARIEKSVANITRPATGSTITALPGDVLRYTITVTNTGDRTLSDLDVRDELSTLVDYRSGGSYNRSNRIVSWTISRLGVGESKSLTLDVTAGVCSTDGTIENIATVDNAQIVARTSNKATVILSSNISDYRETSGPLSVTIDTDNTLVDRGEDVSLRVAIRNQAGTSMNNGSVRVTLPENLEFRNADRQSEISGNVLTFSTGVLAPAGIDEIRVTVTVKNGAVVGERLPVSADANYRGENGENLSAHGELALTVSDANSASVLGSGGFFPSSLVGWLLILLLLIVIVLLLKRALKKEYEGKPAN